MPDSRSPEKLRSQLYQNSALIVVSRFLGFAASLLAVPVIISKLGIPGYGAWEVILAVASLTIIVNRPMGGTLLWKMSAAYGANDPAEIRRLVRIGVAATLLLFMLINPVVWMLRYPLVHLLHNLPVDLQNDAAWILPCLVAMMTMLGVIETLQAVLGSYQRIGVANVLQTVAVIVNYLVVIAALLAGLGLWSLLPGFAARLLIMGTGLYWATTKICGPLNLLPVLPRRTDLKPMGRYFGLMMTGYLAAAFRGKKDVIVLGTFGSLALAGYYGIATRLSALIVEAYGLFSTPLLTAVGALYAVGDWKSIKRLYSNMMRIVPFATGALIILVAGLHDRLMVLWMGQNVPEVRPMLLLVTAGYAFAVMLTGPGASLCRGIGRIGIETAYLMVNLVANIILTIVLVAWIGPMGAVISSAVTWAFASVVFACIMHRLLDLPREATLRAAWTMLAVLITLLLTWFTALFFVLPTSRPEALLSIVCLGLPALGTYIALAIAFRVLPLHVIRSAWSHLCAVAECRVKCRGEPAHIRPKKNRQIEQVPLHQRVPLLQGSRESQSR